MEWYGFVWYVKPGGVTTRAGSPRTCAGTVFSGPNWVDFGIFLFFFIIVRLSFYRLYVTPTTYL